MPPRIVFVVMSAVARPATVDQLAHALAPHRVLIHHDFAQTPGFALTAPNVDFVPDPVRTGWATFGFVEGIFHALAHAVRHLQFDYLQLLSPTCLPVKPIAQFEAHVREPVDAHFGAIDLLHDAECLMNVGYRAFAQEGTLAHRALRRLSAAYYRGAPGRRDDAGVWLRVGGPGGWRALALQAAMRSAALSRWSGHPFRDGFRPYYGSVWFGARPHVVAAMVEEFEQPAVREYFRRVRISEEFLVPSLLMRHSRSHGALHHVISRFDQAHPLPLTDQDLPELQATPAFFARKFPDDPAAVVRRRVLRELVGGQAPEEVPPTAEPTPEPAGEATRPATALPADRVPPVEADAEPALPQAVLRPQS